MNVKLIVLATAASRFEGVLSVWMHKDLGDKLASGREIAQAISNAIPGRKDV